MNAINVIRPYKCEEMWVFDDEGGGLRQQPFVAGADTMIDRLVADIPNADKGFSLLFSASPFPGFQAKLVRQREEMSGNWYYCELLEMEGWLCPALFKYFTEAPQEIYVQMKAK